jgi:AraC-like DNA-binding protein
LHAFIRRLRLEMAVFQMLHGPKATLTAVALRTGFASSSDFSRAFKQTYGFSPRGFSRDRFLIPANRRVRLRAGQGGQKALMQRSSRASAAVATGFVAKGAKHGTRCVFGQLGRQG